MAEELSLKINIGGKEQVIESVRDLKKAIKDAEFEAFTLSQQFGESDERVIQIRKEVGELKNSMADATDQAKAFSEDSKFPVVAQSIRGLASGFTAVQGAMALIGVEGEAVEKTLLKVQSALAISEGLGGVIESIDTFKILSSTIKGTTAFRWLDVQATRVASFTQNLFTGAVNTTSTAFKGLKTAIVGTGIGALVVVLGLVIQKMMEWADNTEEVEKATEQLNRELESTKQITEDNLKSNDYATKMALANAKKRGASEEELLAIEKNGNEERNKYLLEDVKRKEAIVDELKKNKSASYETIKKANDEFRNAQKTYNDALEQDALKNAEREATRAENARKNKKEKEKSDREKDIQDKEASDKEMIQRQEDALQVQIQAELDAKSERDQALYQAEVEYEERRKTLLRANITDFAKIDEALKLKRDEINKKFDEEEKKKQEEKDKEQKDRLNKIAQDEREILQLQLQDKIDAIDEENAKIEMDFEQDLERLAIKRNLLAEQEASELSNTELTEFERTQIRSKYAKQRSDVAKQEVETEKAMQEAKIELNNAYLDLASQFGSVLQQIAGKNKTLAIAGVVVEQVASISKIVSNTAVANAKAVSASFATGGMPWVAINTASAGLSIASTINSAIKSINEIKKQSGGGGEGSAPASVGNLSAPMTASAPPPNSTLIDQQSINALGNQAIRTYVVESDLTTNQQRIEAIRQRARFS